MNIEDINEEQAREIDYELKEERIRELAQETIQAGTDVLNEGKEQ